VGSQKLPKEGHIRRGRHDWAEDLEQMYETWILGKSGIAKKAQQAKEFLILLAFSLERIFSKGQLILIQLAITIMMMTWQLLHFQKLQQ
jgi:hypothetical protein